MRLSVSSEVWEGPEVSSASSELPADLWLQEALEPGVRFYHMNFKRVEPNIFLSNQSRLIFSIYEMMSTDDGK